MQKRARKPLNASGHRFADLTLVTGIVFRASKPLRDLAAKLVTSLTDSFSSKEFTPSFSKHYGRADYFLFAICRRRISDTLWIQHAQD